MIKSEKIRIGYYILLIKLRRKKTIKAGSLEEFAFEPGRYAYIGSAMNGLQQRVARHLRKEKALRWHIDYLLAHAEIVDTALFDITEEGAEEFLRNNIISIIEDALKIQKQEQCAGSINKRKDSKILKTGKPLECLIAEAVVQTPGASVPVPRFGASDCRCAGHLVRLPD